MTAIAYRDGIMAADTRVTGGSMDRGDVRKIHRSSAGILSAAAGYHGACVALAEWVEAGMKGDFDPKAPEGDTFGAIIVHADGSVLHMDAKGRIMPGIQAPFHTQGACEEMLCGAMAQGATAQEAVEIAIRWSMYAGGKVQVEKLAATPQGEGR